MNILKYIIIYDFCKMFCLKVKNVKLVWICVEIGKCLVLKMSFKFFLKEYLFLMF